MYIHGYGLIFWTPKYCLHPSSSSSSFRCCKTCFWNVLQGVLYSHTCSNPCLYKFFFEIIGVAIDFPLWKRTAFLCSWCTHNTIDTILQIMDSCLTTRGIFVIPSCVVVNQIRSEFLIFLGTLFQEDVCEVTFLCARLNFNILIIGNDFIRCAVCGLWIPFQKN